MEDLINSRNNINLPVISRFNHCSIVVPLAKSRKLTLRKLAGAPTIVGAWIGGFLYSPVATIIFCSIGAGVIFQVVYSNGYWVLRTIANNACNWSVCITMRRDEDKQ